VIAGLTLLSLLPLPRIRTDTNPKNMLPPTSPVRVRNAAVEQAFSLYEDIIVVEIQNDAGVLDPTTLDKIRRLTQAIMEIPSVATRDVTSFLTVTNVSAEGGTLRVGPLMPETPRTPADLASLRQALFGNPLFIDRIISRDGKTTAIYVPLEKAANGKVVADQIRSIVRRERGSERYYIAGDPVARDTFGAEMFSLMGLFSPIAGMVMFVAIYLMFRSLVLACTMMAVAMVAILWSVGGLVALGYPIHIMSSMSPVFLMAIATDSIHIFNEFSFRRQETGDRRSAVLATMDAVSRPVRYTALATAAGFGVLLFMGIIPVKVFGGLVAFGTIMLRVLSFSLIPAVLTLMPERAAGRSPGGDDPALGRGGRLLRRMAGIGTRRPGATLATAAVLLVLAAVGTSRIVVNNNMVEWFKSSSDIRVADRVINEALGGTSLGYVVASSGDSEFFKSPEALRALETLQHRLEQLPVVGKTFSVADYVKRINRMLHDDNPQYENIPEDREAIGQYLFLFSMAARPSDLDNVVDYSFQKANLWVQLRTWDATAMREVLSAVQKFQATAPGGMKFTLAGPAYFNLVWNDEVLWDMVRGFLLALVVVFVLLAVNFRSVRWAVVGYLPLLFTILLIYGVVGWAGKDFDMPIAVLSCLSLGMAVDFSIHFIGRFQQHLREPAGSATQPDAGALTEALLWTAARPGRGILRNAVLFASAFSVMLLAPLTPYVTVGAFIVAMMLLSGVFTLLLLPALITVLRGWLFPRSDRAASTAAALEQVPR
jgi:predicted RND superfamily exporter protein